MAARDTRPLLLFFTSETSGPGRRMESLLAYLARKERERLRVTRVDVGRSPELAKSLGVSAIPALVLVADGKPAARLEGRVSAPQIESMLAPHLEKPTPSNPDRSIAA